MKILVIEDEAPLREEILEMLTLERFQALGAENGQIGVQIAREQQPDLILCDVMMPEMDGHSVLLWLRQDQATALIPFIFLTARASKSDLRQGMTLGADDYLAKPFTRRELLDAIAAQSRKRTAIEQQTQFQMDELRSCITRSLPHELHTPLAGIISMTELLIADYPTISPEEGVELLETIQVSAERLYRLTQNFLLYAELELLAADPLRAAMLRQQPLLSNAHCLVADVAQQVAQRFDRLPDLQLTLAAASAPIAALRLQKIVEELLDNAFKFSPSGTPVCVVCCPAPFCLEISDSGRGMTAAQIARVGAYLQFDRRLHEQQGSGLGLMIAKRLIELHGGQLAIESTLGTTTVRVEFPRTPASDTAASSPSLLH